MDPTNNNQSNDQASVASPTAPTQSAAPTEPVAPAEPAAPVQPVDSPADLVANPNVSMPEIDPSLIEQDTTSGSDFNDVGAPDVMVGATDPITMPNPPKAPDPIEEELKAPMTAAAPVPGSIGSAISVPAEQSADNDSDIDNIDLNNANIPNDAPKTPNVAFNDPASPQGQPAQQTSAPQSQPVAPAKKKMSKSTLIMLCALAGIAVVALVIVLIMMINQ